MTCLDLHALTTFALAAMARLIVVERCLLSTYSTDVQGTHTSLLVIGSACTNLVGDDLFAICRR